MAQEPHARVEGLFLVDTGAIDSRAPASELTAAGFEPVGRAAYELADGTVHEYPFGLAQIEFMGEVTAGRVIFGAEGAEPILGVTALESVGITLDPATRTLKRLPAVPLKATRQGASHRQSPIASGDVNGEGLGPSAGRSIPR